jgi:NAD(P)H-flavin reductase
MVHHIKNNGIDHKNIYLIFGCRKKEDLLYYNELTALQSELKKFQYIPTHLQATLGRTFRVMFTRCTRNYVPAFSLHRF